MTVLTEFAPAKINLTLEVPGKRPDGYHQISSLVVFASDVGDRVAMADGRAGLDEVSGPFGEAIAGENLIEKTLRLLAVEDPDLELGAVQIGRAHV